MYGRDENILASMKNSRSYISVNFLSQEYIGYFWEIWNALTNSIEIMKIIDNVTYWWNDIFEKTEEKNSLFAWIYSKKVILIFITILFLVFLQDQINQLVFLNFIDKLFDLNGHKPYKTILLCIVALFVLVFFGVKVFKHRYRASFLQWYIFSFIFFIYAFHRFENFGWCEFSLKYGKPFVYLIFYPFLEFTISLVLTFFIIKFYRHKYQPSFTQIFILYVFSLAFAIYAYYTFKLYKWCELLNIYSLLHDGKPFVYLDIVFILAVYPILKFTSLFFINYHPLEDKVGIFSEDNPLKEEKGNQNFGEEPKNLAKRINEQTFTNSFTIGILGGWGSGKTSFINQLLFEIKELNKESIIIKFNAFQNMDEKSIIRDFFLNITKAVQKYNAKLSSDFEEYLKYILDQKQTNQFNPFYKAIKLFTDDRVSCASDQYEKINKALKRMNRQLIISIDDLDRYTYNEIIEILKIIRNTANFHNTVYLLACDKQYIISTIKEKSAYNSNEFIQKFIQFEYLLKAVNKNDLFSNFSSMLKIDEKYKQEYSIYFESLTENEFSILNLFLSNHRDVIKLANQLNYGFKQVKEGINIYDFFFFNIMKIKYTQATIALGLNFYRYLVVEDGMYKLKMKNIKSDEVNGNIETTQSPVIFEEYKKYYENDLEGFKTILKQLFDEQNFFQLDDGTEGEFPQKDENKKISSIDSAYSIDKPESLQTYLNSLINEEVIKKEKFLCIETDFEQFKSNLSGWLKKTKNSLIYNMNDYSTKIDNINKYSHFLNGILEILYINQDKEIYTTLIKNSLVIRINEIIQDGKVDITQATRQVFEKENKSNVLKTKILKEIYIRIVKRTWEQLLKEYIQKVIEENHSFEEIYKIFAIDQRQYLFPDIFRTYLQKNNNLVKLIQKTISYDATSNGFVFINEILNSIYPSNSLENLFKEPEFLQNESINEFLEFKKIYQYFNYPIVFEFKTLDIKEKITNKYEILLEFKNIPDNIKLDFSKIGNVRPFLRDENINRSMICIRIRENENHDSFKEQFDRLKRTLVDYGYNIDDDKYDQFKIGELTKLDLGNEECIEILSMQPASTIRNYLKDELKNTNSEIEDAEIVK